MLDLLKIVLIFAGILLIIAFGYYAFSELLSQYQNGNQKKLNGKE